LKSFHKDSVDFIRSLYGSGFIPLHRPIFEGREKDYLVDCIDSNFVSTVGVRVTDFEDMVCEFTGAGFAVATVNGTTALQVALQLVGVRGGEEVITQALTFVAICNAIASTGAKPVFVDVDRETMGMSPHALRQFLSSAAEIKDGRTYNKNTGKRFAACCPMHTFGNPCHIEQIVEVCDEFSIPVVEDAAESLGSFVGERHTGTFGKLGALSFNGNKIITTGGGGMILTADPELAAKAKHLTTTAKIPHPYAFIHDEIGYNFRLPNLNAALGCAQMERLPEILAAKEKIALAYDRFYSPLGISSVRARTGATSNHWLNAILLDDVDRRDEFLEFTNEQEVMTRPVWRLMTKLPMFSDCQHDGLPHSLWLEDRVVNVPSSVPDDTLPPLKGLKRE